MRTIEEIYDSRYARDTQELREEAAAAEAGNETALAASTKRRGARSMPGFVVEFFTKRYGLPQLVDQMSWDLLYNMHQNRSEYLEVELFARFMEEFYDADDLLFLLYVRSVLQKELRFSFRTRWAELAKTTANGAPKALFLTQRQAGLVARVVFGSESDPMYQSFMDLVAGKLNSTGHGKLEAVQFLHLALSEYHESRPAPAGADSASDDGSEDASEASEPAGGRTPSKAPSAAAELTARNVTALERDALFKEAEAEFAGKQKSSSPDRASGAPAADASQEPLSASQEVLEALGEAMASANKAYLTTLLRPAAHMPMEVRQRLAEELENQLEAKVDALLERTVLHVQGVAVAEDLLPLAEQFEAILRRESAGELASLAGPIAEFTRSVLAWPELKADIEMLAEMLITYADSRLEEAMASAKAQQDSEEEEAAMSPAGHREVGFQ